ncbi:hypothetical protein PF005_g6130 [Phytophthora fragariae]|uniref:DUF4246 domain-containing protein n=1 Tax=Phytophthora fragariae TaxID=53985 RepID=A0A6A3SW00_9STRA|nr:hypothetical protein PF003_g24471 [Phytophthora fragariae]KAE8943239.1 hypothetical protein PF009_g7022 [Phytophthora fragariae]KAE9124999.1 hypothetical protein PF007_g6507 [Phytophthora fragariae]KAE9129173.1 hypothetical protein PF010_g4241 [Phytophthora fragariae]KAE9149947.1 hypothetical protein PF006_g5621 [Phytophthora fragariae]
MSGSLSFRRRELQCHQSANAVNDRSSYVARRLTELDVLSAIGSVVNALQGRGAARFTQCEATRTTWLSAMDRALLVRYLSRLLRFSPSLEDTRKHFRSNSSIAIGEGLDDYKALIHHAVFALIDQRLRDDEEVLGVDIRPERLARMLHCARQKALPMLMAWLLKDCASFQQLLPNYDSQHKTLDALRLSVRQDMAATRVFITEFLSALGEHGSDAGLLMATHIPETFICDGSFDGGDSMLSFKYELDELRVSYAKTHGCDGSLKSAIQKDILDPSLRCRVYYDGKNQTYQWLPTEFHVGVDGSVTVLSPLHGSTHPHQFPRLYSVIPRILGRMLPLFERVLGSIATQDPPPPYQVGLGSSHQPEYNPVDDEKRTEFSLRSRQLQVVVKLSTIELDEAHPVFAGDQYHDNCNRGWQLDGDDCENIVSVGYHVLRSRNITPPRLSFRAFAHCPTAESELSSQEGLFLAFGERTSAFHGGRYGRQFLQPWGSLVLHEGRSIATPSFLAHRFEPFELLDATNPEGGELTLVDPTRDPIVSTRTVRPEQWQQTRRFVQANIDMLRSSSIHFFLPDEVSTLIADFAASHVSESQAQLTRHRLLMQRQKLQELRFMTPSLRLEGEIILHLNEDDE